MTPSQIIDEQNRSKTRSNNKTPTQANAHNISQIKYKKNMLEELNTIENERLANHRSKRYRS